MIDIRRITAREFHRSLGEVISRARHEPVAITTHGRDDLVLLSAAEYERLKRRDRSVHLTAELPNDLLALAEQSEMDERHRHLDAELGDWKP
ncbi:MAG: type II toxin-antitoxin system prevent-host-death family antitoxin [Rhodomicrobium sp.]